MSKGRNAAKTFNATRAARFAETRKKDAAKKEAERAAGTRRTLMVVDVSDVRSDDEVAVKGGGFEVFAEVGADRMETAGGKTFVKRFVTA